MTPEAGHVPVPRGPAPCPHSLAVLLLPLVQEPAVLGVQMGRVRPEHLGLRPGESRNGQGWMQGAAGMPGQGRHRPQVLQVGSGARRVRQLRGGRGRGSPEKGTEPSGRGHHLPNSALQQLGIHGGQRAPHQPGHSGKLAGGHSAGLEGQRGDLESARQAKDLGWESQVPEPRREKGGIKHRKELYLGSSKQLGSLQVCENGRDAVGERVAQEGGILGKELGKGTSITDHDWQMGQTPRRPAPWGGDEPQEHMEVLGGYLINPQKDRKERKLDTGTLQSWLGDILSP